MKFVESLGSIIIGLAIAMFILRMPKVSTYGPIQLDPAPVDYDDSNLALIGAGLATQAPTKSVMDAAGPDPSVVLMNKSPTTPLSPSPLRAPTNMSKTTSETTVNSQMKMAPMPRTAPQPMPPLTVMPQPMPPLTVMPQPMPPLTVMPQPMPPLTVMPQPMPPQPSTGAPPMMMMPPPASTGVRTMMPPPASTGFPSVAPQNLPSPSS